MRKRYELPTISPESSRESLSSLSGGGSNGVPASDSPCRWIAALLLLLSVAWSYGHLRGGVGLDVAAVGAMTHAFAPAGSGGAVEPSAERTSTTAPRSLGSDIGSTHSRNGQNSLGQTHMWERALRGITNIEQQLLAVAPDGVSSGEENSPFSDLVHQLSDLAKTVTS